jgi:hypothetical protein
MSQFALYYTLNQNIIDKELSSSRKQKLNDKISETDDYKLKKAIIMLIAEHAKINGKLDINSENIKLPHGISQKSEDVIINIDKLPHELQQILWKFMKSK